MAASSLQPYIPKWLVALPGSCSLRASIPSGRAAPHDLVTSQMPTLNTSSLRQGFSMWILGGHRHSDHSRQGETHRKTKAETKSNAEEGEGRNTRRERDSGRGEIERQRHRENRAGRHHECQSLETGAGEEGCKSEMWVHSVTNSSASQGDMPEVVMGGENGIPISRPGGWAVMAPAHKGLMPAAYKEKMKELSVLSLICSCFYSQPHPNTIYQYGGEWVHVVAGLLGQRLPSLPFLLPLDSQAPWHGWLCRGWPGRRAQDWESCMSTFPLPSAPDWHGAAHRPLNLPPSSGQPS